MYYQTISQCVQMLENIEGWLDKAEQHSVAKKSDVSVLMTARLAPDMKPFIYQQRLRLCQSCRSLALGRDAAKARRQ
jgi:hypothetical protein